ncbi:MAG TPA: tetratricopeptide repeat protein, partial [Thermoanaerobaculia bacterium]
MRGLTFLFVAGLAIASPGVVAGQGASDSLEREARSAFRGGRFRDAATKFQDAAASAADAGRRGKMELQAGWSHFNDRNAKLARESVRRAFTAEPALEIVPEFFSPDFLRLVDEVRAAVRSTQIPSPPAADLAELKRISEEKLRDGHAAEVVYDLTNLPPGRLDPEGWALLARAFDASGRPAEAAEARKQAAVPAATVASPPEAVPLPVRPTPAPTPTSSAVPAPERSASPIGDILAGGRAALQRGDAFLAQSAANHAIELEPNSSEAYRLLGDSYAARGEKALAEANWKQSLKLNERNEGTLVALSNFQLGEKNWPAAIDYLERSVSINPSNAGRLLSLARKARAARDLPHAVQVFASAVKASPEDGALQTEYGAVLVEAGQIDQALDRLMQAAALLPSSPTIRTNLAGVFRRKGLRNEAEREFREALRIEPSNTTALYGLATLLLETGRAREATALFEQVLQNEPRNASALIGLSRGRKTADGLAAAAAVLEQATRLDDGDVWNEAGAVAFERRRFTEAVVLFDRALAKKPGSSVFR